MSADSSTSPQNRLEVTCVISLPSLTNTQQFSLDDDFNDGISRMVIDVADQFNEVFPKDYFQGEGFKFSSLEFCPSESYPLLSATFDVEI